MSPADRPALSVAETADLFGISRWLVQQAVRDGSLPSLRVGRRILIPKVQLEALLAEQGVGAPVGAPAAVVRLAAGGQWPRAVLARRRACAAGPSPGVHPDVARVQQ